MRPDATSYRIEADIVCVGFVQVFWWGGGVLLHWFLGTLALEMQYEQSARVWNLVYIG